MLKYLNTSKYLVKYITTIYIKLELKIFLQNLVKNINSWIARIHKHNRYMKQQNWKSSNKASSIGIHKKADRQGFNDLTAFNDLQQPKTRRVLRGYLSIH